MRYLLILLLCGLPLLAGAVEFNQSTRSLPLGRVMQVLEDPTGALTIADVSSPAYAAQFRTHDKPTLNAGYSHSVFWLKVNLHYTAVDPRSPRTWFLELAYPPLNRLDLYQNDGTGNYRLTTRTGSALAFSSREVRQSNYLFKLNFVPDQRQTVYLRLQSQGSIQAPLTLWAGTAYMEEQPLRLYVLGAIYGVLLGMLIYNLFIYLSVRDTSYLYYILYIASFGLYQLSVNGVAVEYFWPNNPWWANAAVPFLIGAAALFGSLFARSFLHTAQHSRWLDRILLALAACGGLVMALALLTSYAVALRLATGLALVFTVTIFVTAIKAWYCGQRMARYFIIAWSAFLLGGVVNTLMVLGYLPNVFLTMYASQIGSAIEVALLSLALADRINGMREQQAQILFDASQKLEVLNQQLARSNRLKDEFLATLTHELRTPMNGVIGSLELMQTESLGDDLAQYQQTAAGSARDMMRMVNGILTLTELQAGRLVARPQAFGLRGALETLRQQFIPSAQAKGLEFSIDVADAVPDRVIGDADKLIQCLDCLLDNAFKFTHHGAVRLRVVGIPQADGSLHLSFIVTDTGIGFAFLDEATLYQRFFQLDGSMTREYGGLGIGLAICRQLIELVGGRLTHHSEPRRGSRFQLEVDVKPMPPAPKPAGQSLPVQRAPQDCTVLLVDDNSVVQLAVRGMLLKLGYRVKAVDGGPAALTALHENRFDAVVLDVPEGGFSLCCQIRALPGCGELAVIGMSTAPNVTDRERCHGIGMSEHLAKPVRFEALQAVLERLVLCPPEGESAESSARMPLF
ncbi:MULTISPECIES: hybrid sensor histidine kinase/response regulator [Pseudomonas]|jgi:signal transduction histidine kinase/ActR/RegA family two-component response regulator|uniref:histidine kinase n=1 Tax=Pseudomonas fluorescens TaxID=294 RepID=A0A2N1E9J8_PSEFL|nr:MULTISPECIES: hybrid sensor histidine kinase/response regulator [Pseudomonas]PKH22998.1 hybrid sensor histidine kinase/response regulator [Pseudomonas fluorescens]TKK31007.1 hybrid sensor histidine kinase/response regulator [Pseudomonas sp. CFBP13528]CRM61868.1 Signal transduction histidine-protein kinase BarA [Pseudomonas sp. 37 R 15]